MTLPRPLCRLLFTSLLAATALPAWAAVRMTVTVDTRNVAHADAKGPPGGTRQSDVVLGDDIISIRSGNITQVFDFGKRRRYVIDEAAKTYDDYSLFDTVGFREIELRNRDSLRKALAAVKLEHKDTPPIEDEHALSMLEPSPGIVATRTDGDDAVFASGMSFCCATARKRPRSTPPRRHGSSNTCAICLPGIRPCWRACKRNNGFRRT